MAWYRTGTVAVTGGGPNVVGTSTLWTSYAKDGDGMLLPDGKVYEVLDVVDNTHITLATNYGGTTASGQAYGLFPTHAYSIQLASQVTQLIGDYSAYVTGPGAGKFSDGTVSAPGMSWASDTDSGFYRPGANMVALSIGGTEFWRATATGLGIGKTPAELLDIKSAAGRAFVNVETAAAGQTARLGLKSTTSDWAIYSGTGSGNVLGFYDVLSGAERARFDGGNFMIGTQTAAGKFAVHSGRTGNNGTVTGVDSTMIVDAFLGSVADAAAGYVALAYKHPGGNVAASGFDGHVGVFRGQAASGNTTERTDVTIKTAYSATILRRLNGSQGLVEFDFGGTTYIGLQLVVSASRDIYASGRYWGFVPFLVQAASASNVVTYAARNEWVTQQNYIAGVAGGVEVFRGTSAGALLVGQATATGDAKLQVSNGVRFGSTLSSDLNTLDYYEEGVFTPTVVGLTTAGVGTYTSQIGRYTRIGNRVHFSVNLVWTAHTGSGSLAINGLPFVGAALAGLSWVCAARFDSLTYTGQLAAVIGSASSQILLRQMSTGAVATEPAIDTAALLHISGTYEV